MIFDEQPIKLDSIFPDFYEKYYSKYFIKIYPKKYLRECYTPVFKKFCIVKLTIFLKKWKFDNIKIFYYILKVV